MGLANRSQYEYLFEALLKEFPGLQKQGGSPEPGDTYFQFTGQPIEAKWISGQGYPAFVRGNTANSDIEGFYRPGDTQISEAYKTYMMSIAPTNMQSNPEYQTYQKQLDTFTTLGTTLSNEANNAFKTWLAQNPEYAKDFSGWSGYQTWLASSVTGGANWKEKIDKNQADIKQIADNQAALVSAIDAPLAEAKKKAFDPKYNVKYSEAGTTIDGPQTFISQLSKAKADWSVAAPGDYELNATINKNTQFVGSWNRNVKTSVSRKCGRVSTHTEINYSRILQDKDYNFNIKAVGCRVFEVNRGDWYNPTFLSAPGMAFPEGSRDSLSNYFGKEGHLSMIPVSFLVIYKPSVEITISTSTYEQVVKNYFDASGSISFFGLKFSMSAGQDKMVKHLGNNTVKITLDANSGPNATPMLFGASSTCYYRPDLG